MKDSLLIRCANCGQSSEVAATVGCDNELVRRIEFLEQRLFDITEENKNLRQELSRLLR